MLDEEDAEATASTGGADPKRNRDANPEKLSSWLIAGNLVVALGVNILLFVALPLFLTRLPSEPARISKAPCSSTPSTASSASRRFVTVPFARFAG